MFISTFLFLSVSYFYCYYFYLISQQCSSWSPESSAKSQQCSSLPGLTKGQFSCSKSTLSLRATLYYDGITATHSAPRSPICLLAIFTSREKPSRYIRWSLVCGVVYYIKYITIECIAQSSRPGIEHQIECARHIPTPIVLQSPYQQNLTRRVSLNKTG